MLICKRSKYVIIYLYSLSQGIVSAAGSSASTFCAADEEITGQIKGK